MRSRREEYSDASRRALLDSARRHFSARGFASTSLDDIAADARLTKGAVYHHFTNKQALFEIVLAELETESVLLITEAGAQAIARGGSSWDAAMAGLDAFLDHCLDVDYQRICFLEGPLALGFRAWWEQGELHEIALIRGMLVGLDAAGLIESDDIDVLTLLLFGSLLAAAIDIARSEEPQRTRDRVQDVVARMVWGLRPAARQAGSGTPAPASSVAAAP
ncbi:MAG: TetR/AcrR family transcriptional regulator [Actinomycetota bacterium]|nr:TetR/AcrR family transcriptional regulator [Actinomycetota bacterium]